MHTVASSNYIDLNKTVALRTGVSGKKRLIFSKFHTNFRVICPFRLYKIFQCWINQENLTPLLELIMKIKHKCFLNPSIQFFIDLGGLLLLKAKKGMHYAQLKFTCLLNRTLFSYTNCPPKQADTYRTFIS